MRQVTAYGSDWEWHVWRHSDDRWINSLRLKTNGLFELIQRERADGTLVLELGRPVIAAFRWNADLEQFEPPAPLDPRVTVLEPLADQVRR